MIRAMTADDKGVIVGPMLKRLEAVAAGAKAT
jgi:hypothetical protein